MDTVADRSEGVVRPWPVGLAAALIGEAAYVAVATDAQLARPRPPLVDVLTITGLVIGAIGLVHLGSVVGTRFRRRGARSARAGHPWSMTLAASLLFVFEAACLAVGMYTLRNPVWEDIGGLVTLAGLVVGVVGIGYLVLTVPALLGRRWARTALLVLSVPVVAYMARFGVQVGYDGTRVYVSLLLALLAPLLGTALMFVPASRPYFARRPE